MLRICDFHLHRGRSTSTSRLAFIVLLMALFASHAGTYAMAVQQEKAVGTYTNPILFADYSDPDVIRVGSDYYLVASRPRSAGDRKSVV